MHRTARTAAVPVATLLVAALFAVVGPFAPASARSHQADPAVTPGVTEVGPEAAFVLPDFYQVPNPLPAGEPGDIIKTETIDAPEVNGTVLRVMYHSRSIRGADIAVTGIIAVPDQAPAAGGYPVMAWAHGTTGIADQCAPSLEGAGAVDFANAMLDRGWVVTGTDYEGLGTPGRHPYIVGDSQARGVIDSVRAARNLPTAGVGTDYLVWGHSQGGHAAMFSHHIAEAWAPELELRGVVAGAPPSQLDLVYDYLKTSPYRYYLLMVGAAINAAYGDEAAPLEEILNPQGIETMNLVDDGCTGFLAEETGDLTVEDLMVLQPDGTYNPINNPTWGPLIAAQDPKNFAEPNDIPLLIIHGGDDEQIPTVSSEILAGQLCATGQDLERWMYPGQTHAGVIAPSFADMVSWMELQLYGDTAVPESAAAETAEVDTTICVEGEMVDPNTPVSSPTTSTPPSTPGDPGTGAVPATPVSGTPDYTG